jgi:hypothetical protein
MFRTVVSLLLLLFRGLLVAVFVETGAAVGGGGPAGFGSVVVVVLEGPWCAVAIN